MYTLPRLFNDCVSSNTVERSARKNSECLLVAAASTDHFDNLFVWTIVDWNHVNDQQVVAETRKEFCFLTSGLCLQLLSLLPHCYYSHYGYWGVQIQIRFVIRTAPQSSDSESKLPGQINGWYWSLLLITMWANSSGLWHCQHFPRSDKWMKLIALVTDHNLGKLIRPLTLSTLSQVR